MSTHLCEACEQRPMEYVMCSPFGAYSLAYCRECAAAGREPWHTVVGAVWMCGGMGNMTDEAAAIVTHNLELHNKTVDDLSRDATALDKSYSRYLGEDNNENT